MKKAHEEYKATSGSILTRIAAAAQTAGNSDPTNQAKTDPGLWSAQATAALKAALDTTTAQCLSGLVPPTPSTRNTVTDMTTLIGNVNRATALVTPELTNLLTQGQYPSMNALLNHTATSITSGASTSLIAKSGLPITLETQTVSLSR